MHAALPKTPLISSYNSKNCFAKINVACFTKWFTICFYCWWMEDVSFQSPLVSLCLLLGTLSIAQTSFVLYSFQWCVRVIFVESESQALRVRVESSKFFLSRVIVMTSPSRVRVEFVESLVCKLESVSSHTKFHVLSTTFFAMKWRPTCRKMAPNNLENGDQRAVKWVR